jgi:predicted DNA-binding ribbon-helix-helix protein
MSRNITINGHRTSVRLEPDMWDGLTDICGREQATLHEICSSISAHKAENTSLTAAIRVFVMSYYRAAATEEGHTQAKHGNGTPNQKICKSPNINYDTAL